MDKLNPLKIGSIVLKNPLILAPMVDVTSLPFRLLCRKYGCSLASTEMVYTNALLNKNQPTENMIKTNSKDNPLALQITGNSPKEFEKAVPLLKKHPCKIIDLNCGCPSTRIVGTQAGSYLLKDPKKISQIIKILKKTGKPVTVKIRLGFLKNRGLQIAKIIEKAGAQAITVHARLSNHPYSIPAQWSEIAKIKAELKIPVIANGDILSPESALSVLNETNCSGLMFARGALSNPMIFKQTLDFLKTGKYKPLTKSDRFKLFNEYLSLCKSTRIVELQKIKYLGSHLLSGFPGASQIRNKLMQLKSFEEIVNFTKNYSV